MNIILTSVFVLTFLSSVHEVASSSEEQEEKNVDPCCSYPCENFGVCNRIGFTQKFECDCYRTGFYGNICQHPTFWKWLELKMRPSPLTTQYILTHFDLFWKTVNNIKFLHRIIMKAVLKLRAFAPPWPEPFTHAADYPTWDGYNNKTYYARTLPPIPQNCPTPMGTKGPKVLPPIKELVEKVFLREKFIPCPRGTTVILPTYGQHFTHMGFKTYRENPALTWGSHSVDLSHIYGDTLEKQHILRSHSGGKIKTQVLNGEIYPPNIKDTPGLVVPYAPGTPEEYKFGLAHPFFSMLPSLLYWTTIWIREHNRVCDILAKSHPDWDDERLYQTSRLVVHGETLKVTVEQYVQHVSGMDFQLSYEPDLIHDEAMAWASPRIHTEFNTIYHWHATMPDNITVANKTYLLKETFFNLRPLLEHGMKNFTLSLSSQLAGRGGGINNLHKDLLHVAEATIKHNRQLRIQPFNRYRQYFKLPPYKTFEELTGEKKVSKILSEFYGGDIDALEFFVGIMAEKRHYRKMFGLTLIEAIAPYALRSVFSNVVASPQYWRESTFGGKVGFDIIKSTDIYKLVCRNVEGCPQIVFQLKDKINEVEKSPQNCESSQAIQEL